MIKLSKPLRGTVRHCLSENDQLALYWFVEGMDYMWICVSPDIPLNVITFLNKQNRIDSKIIYRCRRRIMLRKLNKLLR